MTTRITWLVIGAVAGGVLALMFFAKPLCQQGLTNKANGLLDVLGVGQDSKLRSVIGSAIASG